MTTRLIQVCGCLSKLPLQAMTAARATRYVVTTVIAGLVISISAAARADITVYHDADNSHSHESALAIQLGIELAFSEIENVVQGHKVKFKYLDHRGNVVRSKRNYQEYIDDPQALVMFSGIHSAPLIRNRDFINRNSALTLVPWAAGAPITRHPSENNWVFRLSVDDSTAGSFLINYAMDAVSCRRPHLVIEQTPWGDTNLRNMSEALESRGFNTMRVSKFGFGLGLRGAQNLADAVVKSGSDCVVLGANGIEGAAIVNALARRSAPSRLSVISHWGIVAGQFHQLVPAANRQKVNLRFIQTCFAFTEEKQSVFSSAVFSRLVQFTQGAIKKPEDLAAAVGFVHAYDLTRLLIQALQQISITGVKAKDQAALRASLESLTTPVTGLLKTYASPFTRYNDEYNRQAHEALGPTDYCMGRYGQNNEVLIERE